MTTLRGGTGTAPTHSMVGRSTMGGKSTVAGAARELEGYRRT